MEIVKEYNYDGTKLTGVELIVNKIAFDTIIKININPAYESEFLNVILVTTITDIPLGQSLAVTTDYTNTTTWKPISYFIFAVYDTVQKALFLSGILITTNEIFSIESEGRKKIHFEGKFLNRNLFATGNDINKKIGLTGTKYLTKSVLLDTKKVNTILLDKYQLTEYPAINDIEYTETKIFGYYLLNLLHPGASGISFASFLIPVNNESAPFSQISKALSDLPELTKNIYQMHKNGNTGKWFLQARNFPTNVIGSRLFALSSAEYDFIVEIGNSWYWVLDNNALAKNMVGVGYNQTKGKKVFTSGASFDYDVNFPTTAINIFIVRDENGIDTDHVSFNPTGNFYYSLTDSTVVAPVISKPYDIKMLWYEKKCVVMVDKDSVVIYYNSLKNIQLTYDKPLYGGEFLNKSCNQIGKDGVFMVPYIKKGDALLCRFFKLVNLETNFPSVNLISGDNEVNFSSNIIAVSNIVVNANTLAHTVDDSPVWCFTILLEDGHFFGIHFNEAYHINIQELGTLTSVDNYNITLNYIAQKDLSTQDIQYLANKGLI